MSNIIPVSQYAIERLERCSGDKSHLRLLIEDNLILWVRLALRGSVPTGNVIIEIYKDAPDSSYPVREMRTLKKGFTNQQFIHTCVLAYKAMHKRLEGDSHL